MRGAERHTKSQLRYIEERMKKHGIDYGTAMGAIGLWRVEVRGQKSMRGGFFPFGELRGCSSVRIEHDVVLRRE